MSDKKHIYYAKNLSDIFYQLKSIAGLKIIGGCTQLRELPENSLCIRNIKELAFCEKHERHFDFGPETTLSQILRIDTTKVPSVLSEAVKSIANSNIRNIATLAGNICAPDYKHTLFAPLLALDAKLEFKSETEVKNIPLTKFTSVPKGFILSKIMVPLEEWEVSVFRRLGPAHEINEKSASFVFLANTLKGQLANLRIAFAGPFSIRNRQIENKLLGAYLPLSIGNIQEVLEEAEVQFEQEKGDTEVLPVLKTQFLNLLKYSLEQLT